MYFKSIALALLISINANAAFPKWEESKEPFRYTTEHGQVIFSSHEVFYLRDCEGKIVATRIKLHHVRENTTAIFEFIEELQLEAVIRDGYIQTVNSQSKSDYGIIQNKRFEKNEYSNNKDLYLSVFTESIRVQGTYNSTSKAYDITIEWGQAAPVSMASANLRREVMQLEPLLTCKSKN